MFGLCCKRLQYLVVPSCSKYAADYYIAVNHFDYIKKEPLFSRPYSSKSSAIDEQVEQDHSFTVQYLINSCGLSPKLALSASKKMHMHFESPEKPDSVIKLFKQYELSDTQVSEVVSKCPMLLLYDAEKTLMLKLEFFSSVGLSATERARIFCSNTKILTLSLERYIKPCYDIMKTLGIPDEKVSSFIGNYHMFNGKVLSNVASNVSILREHQVPETSYPLWVPTYTFALSLDSEKVKKNVQKVIGMGFHPTSAAFMKALYVISVINASQWEQKMEFYKKWGWTEDDVLLAFRKSPFIMSYSEENVSAKLDFYMNKLGCKPTEVAERAVVLSYSLKNRVIPRCSIIRVLQSKGLLVNLEVSIITIVHRSDKWFLERFVHKYQDQVPELLDIFHRKLGVAELGLEFD